MKFLEKIKSFFRGTHAPGEEGQDNATKTGFVQFFNRSRGYGFIQANGSQKRIFVHVSELKDQVRKGDRVRFEVEPDTRGPKAVNVELLAE